MYALFPRGLLSLHEPELFRLLGRPDIIAQRYQLLPIAVSGFGMAFSSAMHAALLSDL